jgi:hypothetical protein
MTKRAGSRFCGGVVPEGHEKQNKAASGENKEIQEK